MAQHANLRTDPELSVYFYDSHSPWQRGTSVNTNGLPCRYSPKGADLSVAGEDDLAAVVSTLNTRPRKTFGRRTPADALTLSMHGPFDIGGRFLGEICFGALKRYSFWLILGLRFADAGLGEARCLVGHGSPRRREVVRSRNKTV